MKSSAPAIMAFQQKAKQRLSEMMEQARILVVVSHDLNVLPQLCDRGVWLDKGRVRADGPIDHVIAAYTEQVGQPEAVAA